MTLTYWVCHHMTDSKVFSFRARTRRECSQFLHDAEEGKFNRENYSKPCKIEVEYANAFDLMKQCMEDNSAECRSRYDEI